MRRRGSYRREIMFQTFTENHSHFWCVSRLAYYMIRILTVHVDLITSFRREFCRKRSAHLCVYCFGIIVGAVRTFRRCAACLKEQKSNTINNINS